MVPLHKMSRPVVVRGFVSMLGLLLVLTPLLAGCWPWGDSNPLQLVPLDLGIPADALNSPVVKQFNGNTKLNVRITFKVDPNALKQAQQRPIQPGQPSKVEQFANKLGIDDSTYQKIKSFFNLGGIEFNLSKLRTHLSITAKASTLAKVLQTQFVVHNYNNRQFYAPDAKKPPQVPQFLANSIDAITGLDDFSTPPSHQVDIQYPPTVANQQRPAADCSPQDQTLLPREVAHAYGVDQLWNRGWHGENMTINLVEIDGSYRSDIQNYLDCISFKGNIQFFNVDGHPSDALGESTLDIQMAAGLARSSNINVYQTDGTSSDSDIWGQVNDELQQILNDNVNNANAGGVVSISLGASEGEASGADVRAIDSSLKQLVQVEHMTVFVASGDCGAFGSRVYNRLAVSFPGSDPWVVSVGGTELQIDGQKNRAREVVWSDGSNRGTCKNQWGSGGGNSILFSRPSWQNAPGVQNQYSKNKREVPDVAAASYALAVYFQGQWGSVGGTSAAAPIWATGMALVNQGLLQERHTFGNDTSPQLFYQIATSSGGRHPYYDVTQGNNLYYPATSGWDFATGLGTPNLADFYQAAHDLVK